MGFALDDIWGMSMRKIQALITMGHSQKMGDLVRLANVVRTAYHAEGKAYTEFVTKLLKDDDGSV